MHYLPDTEDEDSAAEKFWPEGYKQVIREHVPEWVVSQLQGEERLGTFYAQTYSDKFSDQTAFFSGSAIWSV